MPTWRTLIGGSESGGYEVRGLDTRANDWPIISSLIVGRGHVWAPKWLEHVDRSECTFQEISCTTLLLLKLQKYPWAWGLIKRAAIPLVDEAMLSGYSCKEELISAMVKSLSDYGQSTRLARIMGWHRTHTTSPSNSSPSLTPFETSDSLLEEFADELSLLDPFPPRNEDDNFDPEADLREIEYLLN
ncbi:hypothetical protein Tco_0321737 [Tanacetum coccineum]